MVNNKKRVTFSCNATYWLKLKYVGYTILEIMIAVALLGIVAIIAVPAYNQYQERVRVAIAIADIKNIELAIERYYISNNNHYPPDLAALGINILDPWGNPYQYYNIADATNPGKGKLRKDKNLVPINSDYDLYSNGADGESVSPLTAKASRDDIVRANNGAYIGLAADY